MTERTICYLIYAGYLIIFVLVCYAGTRKRG